MVRAEVQEALAPLCDRLDELERSMLETIVRLAAHSPTASAPPSHPSLDLTPEPFDVRSGLLSWVRAGGRKRRLLLLALGVSLAIGFIALVASCS
jgi:hypothetical protein